MLKKYITRLFMLLLFSFAAITIALNMREFIICAVVKTDMLRTGEIKQTAFAEALLIKEEHVITAPQSGLVKITAEPGKKVRAGEKIAEIVPNGRGPAAVYSPKAGIVENVDGLENVLTKDLINVIDTSGITVNEETVQKTATFEVDKGRPVCKIVDNLEPITAVVSSKETEKIFPEEGKNVTIIWKGHNMRALVQELSGSSSDRAVLIISDYPEAFAMERQAEIEVVTGDARGLLVSSESLVERESGPGLFVVKGRKAAWEPVQILGETGGGILVEGESLQENDLYVVNPFLVRDGDRV